MIGGQPENFSQTLSVASSEARAYFARGERGHRPARTFERDTVKLKLLGVGLLTLGLAACGGGSSGSGGGGITTPPTTVPTTAPHGDRATTTVSFLLPPNDATTSTSSTQRGPRFVSPGQDKVTLIVDGVKVLDRHKTDGTLAGTYTSPDGNTSMNVSYTNPQPPSLYYTFTVAIDTIPGKHVIGAAIISGSPAIILSEAQQSYTLAPGPNAASTMTLKGVIGTGYIMCDTVANNNANNGCANSFVSDNTANTGGTYTLTAVASDFNSFPIADQGDHVRQRLVHRLREKPDRRRDHRRVRRRRTSVDDPGHAVAKREQRRLLRRDEVELRPPLHGALQQARQHAARASRPCSRVRPRRSRVRRTICSIRRTTSRRRPARRRTIPTRATSRRATRCPATRTTMPATTRTRSTTSRR